MASEIIKYQITEEIIRFAFEVHIKERSTGWSILFTNPTAGPWKKIQYVNDEKVMELGRYEREENRPDLILFHKDTGACLTVEAKDDLSKLLNLEQMDKTCAVFLKEQKRLAEHASFKKLFKKDLIFIDAFLWHDVNGDNIKTLSELYSKTSKAPNPLLCIVIAKRKDDLICYGEILPTLRGKIHPEVLSAVQDLELNKLF